MELNIKASFAFLLLFLARLSDARHQRRLKPPSLILPNMAHQVMEISSKNLSFNFLTNSTIQDITSQDSKLFHVNVNGCRNLTFIRVNITAPPESINTDGIHVARSSNVNITDCVIGTGDDCISIGDELEQLHITRVTCGPGHGISVGSLGKTPGEKPVVGVYVKNCTFINTDNGVRVKTWPASHQGVVTDLHYEDIIVQNVTNPIVIDQVYCPYNQCNKDISKVSIKNVRGTSRTQDAKSLLLCSKGVPCEGVEIGDIDIAYNGKEGPAKSRCENVKPTFVGKQNPPVCALELDHRLSFTNLL
ncbi:hypothetical protein RND71_038277 [Anisodus tanguticus]|uniref:Polygalacturonase n=1 Tax=Anisodus tanguticus TaxID=243964 RepID=A0AAE1UWV3_9SOLA|nr:hypothetical protein RND71_038277 [Anisodus tanguticus]